MLQFVQSIASRLYVKFQLRFSKTSFKFLEMLIDSYR